jgi:hypothetical protein
MKSFRLHACRFPFLAVAVTALAACGAVPNEVVPFRDGMLRAPTYRQATDFCQAKGLSPNMLGRENADYVLFRCK